jgi:hypothetical protein
MNSKEHTKPLYLYLLRDTLVLLCVGFLAVLFVDSILPGFFASFFSLLQAALVIAVTYLLLAFFCVRSGHTFKRTRLPGWIILSAAIALCIFFANALHSFPIWTILAISVVSVYTVYLLEREMFHQK